MKLIILSPATLVILFIRNLISGPLGEELGWRAFFLT
nr:CPBP family glutamic-type intramembrane protease [Paenibacillus sp. OSY-SE]